MLLQQRHRGAEKPSDAQPDVRLGMVLAATAMAMFATNLDFFALNLSIPGMARDLDVSTTDMQAGAASGISLSIVIGMAGLAIPLAFAGGKKPAR